MQECTSLKAVVETLLATSLPPKAYSPFRKVPKASDSSLGWNVASLERT